MKSVCRNIFITTAFFMFLIVLVGCEKRKPEIETTITLSDITEDEYLLVRSNNNLGDTTINDYKKLYINAKIKNTQDLVEAAIIIPDLFTIADEVKSLNGGTDEYSKGTNFTTERTSYVIFYSKGLSEEDIKKILESKIIYISYISKDKKKFEEQIIVGEKLKFEN